MTAGNSPSIAELIDECIGWWFRNNPEYATGYGYHRYDHLLGDMTADNLMQIASEADDRAQQISRLLVGPGLSRTDRHDLTILKSHLDTFAFERRQLRLWERDPGMYAELLILSLYSLLITDELTPANKVECICSRLEQSPKLLQAAGANVTRPMRPAVAGAREMASALVGFIQTVGRDLGGDQDRLNRARATAVAAVEQFSHLVADLAERADDHVSIGQDAYAWLLSNHHFLSLTPDELLAFGQRMVADTSRQLQAVAREMVPGGTWRDALALVNREGPDATGLVDAYRQDVNRIADIIRDRNLVTLPGDDVLIVEPTPDFARSLLPYAAYVPAGGFSTEEQAGRFWVTTVDERLAPADQERLLGEHNPYSRAFTALHEAYPGHHLQLTYNRRYATPARRLVGFPTFIEGWAFYCEQMMVEEGCFPEPGHRLWQLRDQLWRAARIVVDASYHCRGMSFEEAVRYLEENVGMETEHARLEARWYVSRPSYPMSYMVGKHQLLEVRDRFLKVHGPGLARFHDRLLQTGGLPPELAAEVILDPDGTI